MSAELGKIEKPSVKEFEKGRKLFFVPLMYGGKELPTDYLEIFDKYWKQVENQISDLELKLGKVNRIYHELISSKGEEGIKVLKKLNDKSYQITESKVAGEAQLEAVEDTAILTEFMDWSRCLGIGLQNQKVKETVYEAYNESSKNRSEFISKRLNETLEAEEIGILFMGERHKVAFPSDIEIFYISPPALDEIERWFRNREAQHSRKEENETETEEDKGDV